MEYYVHNEKYWSQHSVDGNFAVVSAGYAQITDRDAITYRPNGLHDWQLMYCKSGCIHMNSSTDPYPLNPGEAILFRPHEYQEYVYKQEDCTEGLFVHFGGSIVPEIIEELGLSDFTMGHLGKVPHLESSILKIADTLQLQRPGYDAEANALLLLLLVEISRNLATDNLTEMELRINGICEYMRMNYNKDISNADYADMCNMSLSHFLRTFKRITGVSPQRYILDLQLGAAEKLLKDTTYKIGDIARLVGFDNTLYFSRIFSKHRGVSPSNYRKTTKKFA